MIRLTWVLAVGGLRNSRPRSRRWTGPARPARAPRVPVRSAPARIWRRGPRPAGRAAGKSVISRRVTLGESSASPRATTRTALQQLGGLGVLDQEAAGPGPDRLVDVLVGFERGQDEHLDAGEVLVGRDAPGRFEPVDARASGCPSAPRRRARCGPARPPGRRRRPRRRRRYRRRRPASCGNRPGPAPGHRRAGPGSRRCRRSAARQRRPRCGAAGRWPARARAGRSTRNPPPRAGGHRSADAAARPHPDEAVAAAGWPSPRAARPVSVTAVRLVFVVR